MGQLFEHRWVNCLTGDRQRRRKATTCAQTDFRHAAGDTFVFAPGTGILPVSQFPLMGPEVEPSVITDFRGFTALAYPSRHRARE
jgi:hypothetical protein